MIRAVVLIACWVGFLIALVFALFARGLKPEERNEPWFFAVVMLLLIDIVASG